MKRLSFNSKGKFKIMQIADIQDTQHTSPDTMHMIRKAVEVERPDLVVFSGDQLKGYGFSFKGGDIAVKVIKAINNIVRCVNDFNVPFAVTYGNHDIQSGAGKAFQTKIYSSYNGYVCGEKFECEGDGTFVLEIKDSKNEKIAMNVFVIDSNSYDETNGGYAAVDSEQIKWFSDVSKRIDKDNNGKVPAIVFQHIPVPEMYELLEKTDKKNPEAILGNSEHRDYYALPQSLKNKGGFMKENIACPRANSGEFDAFLKQGNVFAAFFGHDHNNSFVGNYKGVDLGYTQGAGFNVYGPGYDRGVRVFEFDESEPSAYSTRTVTYEQLLGKRVRRRFKKAFYDNAPSSFDAAKPMITKGALCAAAGAAVAVALVLLRK